MAALGTYTTTQAVRGCLGVDANDCPDAYMVDSLLDVELLIDLGRWLPTHATLYSEGTTGTPTAAQSTIANCIKLYAQWFCALEMTKRPLTVPQIATDGKAQLDRFKVDLERLTNLAAGQVAKYRDLLVELVDGETPAVGLGISLVSVAAPGSDPIVDSPV